MCGLAGFVDFNGKSSQEILKNMTDVLYYRGPDDSGYSLDESEDYQVGLGHRRLSILDLSPLGHQPMVYNNLEIVFNGEVYNFNEIRKTLEKEGFTFNSNSDTEVILKAYSFWGNKAVHKFNGMFVITIYDKGKNKVKIFRDRAGVKPLYWYWNDDLFLFSSELKSFHQHPDFKKVIDFNSLALYLQYGYIPQPYSIFKNTQKLKSGHYLELDLRTKSIVQEQYWSVLECYNKPKLKIDEHEAITETNSLLKSAFEYRMVSDVPVGMFLSGGYDSSVTTAIIQSNRTEKVNTFTIGFEEKGFDEAPFAKKVAEHLGTNHTEYYCTQKDALDIIPKLPEIYDEPFGDSSAIPTTLVSQLAKKHVTVSLSADGGDEIFAGYSKHVSAISLQEKILKLPKIVRKAVLGVLNTIEPSKVPFTSGVANFETKYRKLSKIIGSENAVEIMKHYSQHFTFKEVKKLLKSDVLENNTNFDNSHYIKNNNDSLSKLLAIDYQTYMVDDILTKVDRATMSVSLEGREPFLDYRVIEYAATLPSNLKLKNGIGKYLLKEITHKYIPRQIMERPKMGFAVPLTSWFQNELNGLFMYYLDENRLKNEGIFNVDLVIKLRDTYLKNGTGNVQRLWFILLFEMWYEKWIK